MATGKEAAEALCTTETLWPSKGHAGAGTHRCLCRAAGLQHDGARQGTMTIYLILQFQINLHGCWAGSPPVGCSVLPAILGAPGLEGQK